MSGQAKVIPIRLQVALGDQLLRRYVSGHCSEAEQALIEVAYFSDPALLADVEAEHGLRHGMQALALDSATSPIASSTLSRRAVATALGLSVAALALAIWTVFGARSQVSAAPRVVQSISIGEPASVSAAPQAIGLPVALSIALENSALAAVTVIIFSDASTEPVLSLRATANAMGVVTTYFGQDSLPEGAYQLQVAHQRDGAILRRWRFAVAHNP